MAMSRKHYVAFARAIHAQREHVLTTSAFSDSERAAAMTTLLQVTDAMCHEFACDNHRFDRYKFKEACGFE